MIPAILIFAATYLVMAIGKLPFYRLDRAGAALLGACLMVATGVLSLDEAWRAIDMETITLLLGMMIVVANLRLSGFFRLVNGFVVTRARHPLVLLVAVALVSGVFSAFLVNDTVCLMLTPLVVREWHAAALRGPGGRTEVTVTNKDVDEVVLRLRPGSVLSGTMRLEGADIKTLIPAGSPSKVDWSSVVEVEEHVRAIQMSLNGSPRPNARPSVELFNIVRALGGTGMGYLQEDGTFRVENTAPGRYWTPVMLLPEGFYVKSARSGGVDALIDPVDLTEGNATLDLVLANTAGEVSGMVRNERGEAQTNLKVTLWPEVATGGRMNDGIFSAVTDQSGSFRFRTVPPGNYHLAAWESVDSGLLRSHAFLTLFNSRAAAVEVGEGARNAGEAKLIPAGIVAVEVTKLR